MKKLQRVTIFFGVDKIPSINSGYERNWGKVILTEEARTFKAAIDNQLNNIDFRKYEAWLNPSGLYSFSYEVIFNHSVFKRDIDNTAKFLQDAVFTHLGINDSRVVELHARKSYSDRKKEYIVISIEPSSHNVFRYGV